MFEAIDKMIEESTQVTEEDKDVASVIALFDSISEGDVPPQFAKFVKGKDGKSEDDKGEEDDKGDDEEEKDEEVKEESLKLIAHFDALVEGDQERLDKSDDADIDDPKRNNTEQGSSKSGAPKEGANGEVDSDAGVKKDTEGALVDWMVSFEAEQFTQDHQEHKQGMRGAIGDANDGDKNKDDALPDTDDKEAKPETAKKLIDKSVSENAVADWMVCNIVEK